MFATKLKVAFALFVSSFSVWLIMILLVAQPTDNLAQFQFPDFSLLAVFLGSAIAASVSSMTIGLDLLEFKMKPMSLTKKFGRGRVNLRMRKSKAVSPKMQDKDSKVELEKLQTSKTELNVDAHSLEEEIILPDRSLLIGEEVVIDQLEESGNAAQEGVVVLKDNMLSQQKIIIPWEEPSSEKKEPAAVSKRDSEGDSKSISCPKCNKVFSIPLLSLDFSSGKTKMVRSCPHCYSPLASSEDDKTAHTKITDDRKTGERSIDEQKAFFLFGETEFKSCKFKLGYLGSLPENKTIPKECLGCPQLVECFQAFKNSQ